MRAFVVVLLAGIAVLCQSGSIQRNKRGYLSRTGLCVKPAENFKIKDPRLNFWGVAYVLPDDANPKCTESECSEDSHCDADRKCCKNYCGGMVCTPTMRDPNPCKKFQCPVGQTCKIQYVPCVMPKCKDAIAVNRPTCVKDPNAVPPPATPPAAPPAAPPVSPPVVPPVAPGYPEQSSFAPSPYNQQPLAYQPQPQQYPQAPQASFMPQQSMAPLPPPMSPVTPVSAYQNDEPGSEANAPAGFTGNQPDLETGVDDAPLAKALQNENQPLAFQNDSPLPSDQSNFLPPPPGASEKQQPLVNEPAIAPPVANPMMAPQPRWDRSTSLQ